MRSAGPFDRLRRPGRFGAVVLVLLCIWALAAANLPAGAAPGQADAGFGRADWTFVPALQGGTTADLAVQPDGDVIVAGTAVAPSADGAHSTRISLTRLLPDGSVDSSFGSSGVVTTMIGDSSQVEHMVVTTDGDILLLAESESDTETGSGSATDEDGSSPTVSQLLVSYTSDGAPDGSFGSDGQVKLPAGLGEGELALGSDGTILLAMAPNTLTALDADGQVIPDFGDDGTASLAGTPDALTVDGAGDVVVADSQPTADPLFDLGLVQAFTPAGRPDTSFGSAGSDGTVQLPVAPTPIDPTALLPAPDGGVYVEGANTADASDALHLSTSGQVETGFGRSGILSLGSPLNQVRIAPPLTSTTGIPLLLHGTSDASLVAFAYDTEGRPLPGYGTQGLGVVSRPGASPSSLLAAGPAATAPDGSLLVGATEIEPAGQASSTSASSSAPSFETSAAVAELAGGAPADHAQVDTTSRAAGSDRIATAIAVSKSLFASAPADGANGNVLPGEHDAGAVVLAGSDDWADALAGVPLAAATEAPMLLTPAPSLDPRVSAEIRRVLGKGAAHGTIYVLGGPAAVGNAVVGGLADAGYDVVRLAGSNRYGTAVAVADALGDSEMVFEADGTSFADAVSAAAAAGYEHGVLLLTDGSTMPPETTSYLQAHPEALRLAVGGPASRADPSARAIVGADRYATSVLLARACFATPIYVGLATGTDPSDALAGGVSAALLGGPLLLTPPSALPASVAGYLQAVSPWASYLQVFGATSAVSPAVQSQALADIG